MSRHTQALVNHVNARLSAANILGAVAAYVEADDCSTDDEIEIRIAGVAASVSIQVGRGYYGVNRYFYVDGELDGAQHLYTGRDFAAAVERLVSELSSKT